MPGHGEVQLFDDEAEADGGPAAATAGDGLSASTGGPSLRIELSGSTVALDTADLQFYLLAVQTLMLSYVAYKEVSG